MEGLQLVLAILATLVAAVGVYVYKRDRNVTVEGVKGRYIAFGLVGVGVVLWVVVLAARGAFG